MSNNGNGNSPQDWRDVATEDRAYLLTQAEFKGSVLQALKDIDTRVSRIERNDDLKQLIAYLISAVLGALAGFFSGGFHK